jgi:uncharacterized membrane protein
MPGGSPAGAPFQGQIREAIEVVSTAIELLAIGIIVVAILMGTLRYGRHVLSLTPDPRAYKAYKEGMARALLLGLEILVAADVIRTVALEPSLPSVAALGLLVLVRTFLSWALVVETEGRWPWQQRPAAEGAGGAAVLSAEEATR